MLHQEYNSLGSHIYNGIIYRNFDYPEPNFHASYELLYIFEGELSATVDNTEIHLSSGDLLLIAPNTIHFWQKTGDNKLFCGVFSEDFVTEFFKKDIMQTYIKFTLSDDVSAFLKKNLFYTGTPEFYMLKSCLYAICSQCVVQVNKKTDNAKKHNSHFIYEVNAFISNNLNSNFTQLDIANALNYEYHYFSNLFHKHFRVGLKQYVNNFRFKTACRMLSTTELKIAQIANDCGFTSIRSFNRIFKELSGKTPNEYRREVNTTHISERFNQTYQEWGSD